MTTAQPPNLDFLSQIGSPDHKENYVNVSTPSHGAIKRKKMLHGSTKKNSAPIATPQKAQPTNEKARSTNGQNATSTHGQNATSTHGQNATSTHGQNVTSTHGQKVTSTPSVQPEIIYPSCAPQPVKSEGYSAPTEIPRSKKGTCMDYYNLLNVPKDCSPDDLKKAYKRLAMMTHPDRHGNLEGEVYENAKDNFQLIKIAYETLINDKKRMIYDLYGTDGLDAGWDLIDVSGKTRDQVQRVFDEISRKEAEKEEEAEKKVEMTGNITVSLHKDDINKHVLYGKKTIPQIADMTISQEATVVENTTDTLKMGGTIGQYRGAGHGSLNLHWTRRFSSFLRMENKAVSTGEHTFLEFGLFGKITSLVEVYIKGLWYNSTTNGICLGVEKQISPEKRVNFSWNLGSQPQVSCGYAYCPTKEDSSSRFEVSLFKRIFGSFGLNLLSKTDISSKMTLEMSTDIMDDGYGTLTLGGKRKISKFKKFGFFISYEMEGISWGISYETGNQEFKLPIVLWNDFSWGSVLTALVTPITTWTMLKVLYLNPKKNERRRIKAEKRRNEMLHQCEKAKKEALAAIKLMTSVVLRRKQEESAKKGLVIVSGAYGEIPEDPFQLPDESKVANVTIPLQYLVEKSQLHLYTGSKESILGFYNPDPEQPPKLFVRYLFKGVLHQVVIEDNRPLHIPRSAHKLQL